MGRMTKIFVLVPLTVFAVIIFGFGIYNTLCKNAHINLFGC